MTSHKRRAMILYSQFYRDREHTLWLGFMDDGYLTGTRLMTVLCQGAKAETFAYGTLGPLEAIEGFWEQYKQMGRCVVDPEHRSEEHTSELQSLMRNSYAVFCLKKTNS